MVSFPQNLLCNERNLDRCFFDQLTVGYTIYAVNQMAVMIGKKVTY